MLLTGPNSTTLGYDPVMRLQQVTSGATSKLAYDGLDRIAEYDAANALQRRYVHGPAVDEPIVWYEGSGTADRRFLSADERGSIVSVTDSTGVLLGINRYDEFGQPQATNMGVWGYTGQAWLPTLGVWHYKARAYDPELGRFLQTDPIGYEDSPNLYAYVLSDPVNLVDPLGLESVVVSACRKGTTNIGGEGVYMICVKLDWGRSRDVGSNFGSAAGRGRHRNAGETTQSDEPYCEGGGDSGWATVADYAETVAAAADAGAIGAGGIGLVLAPTGAGLAAAGLTALGLKGVAFAASATAAVANWQAGNSGRAVGNLVGAAAGRGAGSMATRGLSRYYARGRTFGDLSAGQVRKANYGGGVTAAFAGDASSGVTAVACEAIKGR